MSHTQRQGGDRRPQTQSGPSSEMSNLLNKVSLAAPAAELFDDTASGIARLLDEAGTKNKPSQVRRFYDQVIRYADAHRPTTASDNSAFQRDLPFIRLICAHAAYAKTRDHVDDNFVAFLQCGIRQIKNADDLSNFRTLFEAVIGFMARKS